ncbi:hypothetical protein [Micromonospora sp. KC723]|uniref:hypothetical protein n=1 Tax=Micromonospora sp. KC723 TaxID=2530381 RepID=UPI001405575F|nr:hypothetical protein [Micromonospora sp. KC723]
MTGRIEDFLGQPPGVVGGVGVAGGVLGVAEVRESVGFVVAAQPRRRRRETGAVTR